MQKQENKISCRAFLVLTVVLCMALFAIPIPALAVTSAEKQAEADALMDKLDSMQDEVNLATADYEEAIASHNQAVESMDEAQARIEAANARIVDLQSRLSTRATAMYRNGSISFLEVLLGAASFDDFIITWDILNELNQQDADMVRETKDARVEAQKAHEEYAAQEIIAAQQLTIAEKTKVQLDGVAASMQSEIDTLTEEASELLAQEEAAADAAEAAAAAAKQIAGRSVIVGSGQYAHPCPAYTYISSTFGWRSFDNAFHKGVDFAAPSGTPIYSVEAGTVIVSGYSSSGGNWVVISHGNGVTTKYMHMVSTPYVRAGQYVTKGQNIGGVGTTGYSTGNHLHFQIEINGTAVDPLDYL